MQADVSVVEAGAYNPLLRTCSEGVRAALFERGNVKSFEAGEALFRDGAPAGVALLPLRGKVQLAKTASSGRRQVFCYLDPHCCPSFCMLMMRDQSLVDAVAIEPGAMLLVDRADLIELTMQDTELGQAAWGAVAECMGHFLGLVENLSFHKVSKRVVLALLQGTNGEGAIVRLTQAELAAEVGTTREVVARCLSDLQGAGAIRLGRGRITVLDRDLLQSVF